MTEAVFHVVCHECPVESLCDSADEADEAAASHTTATDHRVSVARIE